MVLDRAKAEGLTEYLPYGVRSLTASILSILITAPMGALLMASLGPKWLIKSDKPMSIEDKEGDEKELNE